jgi:hypothetical protein
MRIAPSFGPSHHRHLAVGMIALGFGSGLLLGLGVSGGIAGERLTLGAVATAMLANATATVAALVAARIAIRGRQFVWVELPDPGHEAPDKVGRLHPFAVLAPQVVGAALGVAIVHFLLRSGVLGPASWLSERPAQLVNDAVAVFGLLSLAWACAADLDARLLGVALGVLTAYRVTASRWHLDHAPGGFHTTVQELVVAQFVAAALALAFARVFWIRRAREAR